MRRHSLIPSFRSTAAAVVVALVASYAAPSLTPARADMTDAAAADALRAALTGPGGVAPFVHGLAGVGALAAPAPGLTVVPGGPAALGVGDVVTAALGVASGYASAASPSALAAALNGASGPVASDSDLGGAPFTKRQVSWTASATEPTPGVHRLQLGLTVTRTAPSGIRVATTSQPFDFTSDRGLKAPLRLTAGLALLVDEATGQAWVEGVPTLSVAVQDATIDDLADVDAAIGILRVTLDDGSTYRSSANLTGAFRDPNNDGRLTVGPAGELGASGASAGLSTVDLTRPGGGSLAGSLKLTPADGDTVTGLPSATAAVTLAHPDWSTGEPTASYPAGSLDPVQAFTRLSSFDLAQGIAQLSATLHHAQRARTTSGAVDLDLPFLNGTVADLVPATEALEEFLHRHVPQASPTAPGVPDFASFQKMLDQLSALKGPGTANVYSVSIAGTSFTGAGTATPAIRFTIKVHRDASPQPADPLAELLSGGPAGVTYSDSKVEHAGKDWTGLDAATLAGLAGRQVNAGKSTAAIGSVTVSSSPKKVTLNLTGEPLGVTTGSFWKGGTPSNAEGERPFYVINAGDARTGNVELGDLLAAKSGIRGANALRPQATITPAYDLTLPVVLDLRAPVTGSACTPLAGKACPYTVKTGAGGTGPQYVVPELPLRADRFQLTTGQTLLSATSTMTTPVDLTAPVGYVPVRVGGSITVCKTTGGACSGQLQTIATKAQSSPDVPLGKLFDTIRDTPDNALTGTTAATAKGALTFGVVGDPGFFGGAPGATTIEAALAPTPSPTVADGDLAKLKVLDVDTANPKALFGVLLADLAKTSDVLQTPSTANGLGTPVPLLGTSLGQLAAEGETRSTSTYAIDGEFLKLTDSGRSYAAGGMLGRRITVGSSQLVVGKVDGGALYLSPKPTTAPAAGTPYRVGDGLQWAVDAFTAAPPEDLGVLLAQLQARLTADAGSTATTAFTVDPVSKLMTLTLDWTRAFRTRSTLAMPLTLSDGTTTELRGNEGDGTLPIDVVDRSKVVLRIPLTTADPLAGLKVDPTASLRTVRATVAEDALALGLSAGALELTGGGVLRAALAVTGKDDTHTADVALPNWHAALKPTAPNDGTTAQTCTGVTATTPMALCASLPLKKKSGGDLDTLVVRLPKDGTFPGTLDPAGTHDGGARTSPVPLLTSALSAATFDLTPLGTGLQSYVDQARAALDTATAGGTVPLIGKDLQAGQDFLGALRTAFSTALVPSGSAPSLPTYGDVKSALSTAMTSAPVGDHLQGTPAISGVCKVSVPAPARPGVTRHPADPGTTDLRSYTYYVVGQLADGRTTRQSDPSHAVQNKDLADPGHTMTVSWAAVTHVEKYHVFRIKNGGAPVYVGAETATSLVDKGQTGSGAPAAAGTDPVYEGPCADPDSSAKMQSLTLGATFGRGTVSAAGGCTGTACYTADLPLDLGLPGLSLRAQRNPDGSVGRGVQAKLGWQLKVAVTLDKAKGLLLETAGTEPELRVGASIQLPASLDAQLSFLKVKAANPTASTPELVGLFSVDVVCPSGCTAGALPISRLLTSDPAQFLAPKLEATLDLVQDLTTTVDPSLPGIATTFVFKGSWATGAKPEDIGITELAFNNVRIDAKKLLGDTVKPIVDNVVSTLKPVQPILDTVQAPIPVLTDLSHLAGGGDVTILSLAKAFGVGGESVQTVVDVLKTVTALSKSLQTLSDGEILIGSFAIVKEKAKTTVASPDTSDAMIGTVHTGTDTTSPADPDGKPDSMIAALNSKIGGDTKLEAPKAGITFPAFKGPRQLLKLLVGGDATLAAFDTGVLSLGFEFSQSFGPVYAPPPVMLVISGGAQVDLRLKAGFDTYGIRQAVETGAPVQILNSLFFYTTEDSGAPIPVVAFRGYLAAGASVSVAFLEAGVVGGITLTVSFTWADPNNDGKFRFAEFLAAALKNPICLFNVGGELGLFIKLFVKVGFSPFDVSFDFTLASIKVLDFSLKPNCTPPPPRLGGVHGGSGTLYLFAGRLGDSRGDPLWKPDPAGSETWVVRQVGASTVKVQALGIEQTFSDVKRVVVDGHAWTGKLNVMLSGQPAEGSTDKTAPFTLPAVVVTGSDADTIKTGTGRALVDSGGGDDTVTTGDRPDVGKRAAGTADAATVVGNGGADHIGTGNDVDAVSGDGHLTWTSKAFSVTALGAEVAGKPYDHDAKVTVNLPAAIDADTVAVGHALDPDEGTAGNDVISVGLGGATVHGGAGDDSIAVAQDSPLAGTSEATTNPSWFVAAGATLYGNDGSDSINGGSGPDKIYTGGDPGTGEIEDLAGTADPQSTKGRNTVDTGTGNDTVHGSEAMDVVVAHSLPKRGELAAQTATLYGLGGTDVLVGGDGADKAYGGRGDDTLVAQPSKVDIGTLVADELTPSTATKAFVVTPLPPKHPALGKTLVGGGGTDRIYGGDGSSAIWGDHSTVQGSSPVDLDTCVGPGPDSSDRPDEQSWSGASDDLDRPDLVRGGKGEDVVNAGGGDDWVFAGEGANTLCGMAGADRLFGGDAQDTAWGGTGDDLLQGKAGDDLLYGNEGNDTAYGNDGVDVLQGNADTDTLFGGEKDDRIVGGTTTAGRPDAGDTIYGDTGLDLLVGDNGCLAVGCGRVLDLASGPGALGGRDTVYGGTHRDFAYGGLDVDTVRGGDDGDHLEGNGSGDVLHGENGADDVIGGSSQAPGDASAKDAPGYPDGGDTITGGELDDVIAGDNAVITRTEKVGEGDPVALGRGLTAGRRVVLLDLGYAPAAGTSGGDIVSGGTESDVVYGQAGIDTVHGDDGTDYVEGGQDGDVLHGDAGQDDVVGGSSYAQAGTGQATAGQHDGGDAIRGGDGADVVLGDNGLVTRDPSKPASDLTRGRRDTDAGAPAMSLRSIAPYDLGDAPVAGTSGADYVSGDAGSDVVLAQTGNDRVSGGDDGDAVEGGPGHDWLQGDAGDDDLVGGTSQLHGSESGDTTQGQPDIGDAVYGGSGDDVLIGDNALVTRVGTPSPLLERVGSGGAFATMRSLRLLDLKWGSDFITGPTRHVAGGDGLSGGAGVDVLLGQDGGDALSGGAGDDYAEGNGGRDLVYGDRTLPEVGIPTVPSPGGWPAPAGVAPVDPDAVPGNVSAPNGQDDLVGGSSRAAFRDHGDRVYGDGGSDYLLGDGGTIARDVVDADGAAAARGDDGAVLPLTNRVYAKRYAAGALPAGASFVRHGVGGGPTRFCTTAQATCEPVGAFGEDSVWGGDGSDYLYGQDADDVLLGDDGSTGGMPGGGPLDPTTPDDDDMYGELGADTMFGEGGEDAMLGDRGGILDQHEDGSRKVVLDYSQVPQIHYEGFLAGSVTRQVDLLHDVAGDAFVGSGTSAPMPHRGDLEGGNDRMRGGHGHDSVHAGFGDDLANGDSGGDIVFGDDGADVLWGGRGCDQTVDTASSSPDCYAGGAFDPAARGDADRMVDHISGGKGGTAAPGSLGADVLDWRPRGTYALGTGCTADQWPQTVGAGKAATTIDPCRWLEMTGLVDAETADNQHHQGIDWQYGGWDRDVMQADVADNGPNPGDRLLDWTGAYNLYSHCNAAYGGFNDVRQFSPDMQSFLQVWAFSLGAGQAASDVTTAGTSAHDELALVYQADIRERGSGPAYPSTPGHFDDPNACAP